MEVAAMGMAAADSAEARAAAPVEVRAAGSEAALPVAALAF
jgi:hypothetical protein